MLSPHEVLEREFAYWLQAPFVPDGMVACNSGTADLHLALECLPIPEGSEVIIPDYTMVACARACTLAGLKPVFADCLPNLTINAFEVERLIGPNTKAIMIVHTYGRLCYTEAIHRIALKHGLLVIEDCAEAHGVTLRSSLYTSDAYCWSFYKNKIIPGEEGGAVWFSNPLHAHQARSLRCLGFDGAGAPYSHQPRGHNYRMANTLANKVLDSLPNANKWIRIRHEIGERYEHELSDLYRMPKRILGLDVYWVYDIRIPHLSYLDLGVKVQEMNRQGGQVRLGFIPMSRQPEYNDPVAAERNCVAGRLAQQVIYFQIDPCRSIDEQVDLHMNLFKKIILWESSKV